MTINPRPNPYVGARPYQQGETLYGRGREQRRLLNQLIADRIVLLNSPSGAGKTSLIQAALIPDLAAEHFNVLRVARVNTELPKELASRGDVNRYLLSLLLSLDEGLREEGEPTPLDALATTSLDEYLAKVEAADPLRSVVLIVDQFEEIVTVDPTDDAGRQIFFDALSVALRNRKRWALFAMREEFVTRLDPLVRQVPSRLAMRFRLELLSPDGATESIKGPAGDQGVAFDDQAAERLVNDLRTVRVQQEDGTSTDTLGNAVEPVQLQVVCQRLWGGLSADDMVIGADDVAALGDVSQALEAFYDEQVAAAAGEELDRERAIRDWFETQLITPQGIRTQIAQEPGATRGLDNAVIADLESRRLLRRERRRAVYWIELAHDRLIRPVLNSNAAWRESHLAGWQQRAILWDQQGRPPDLLLSGSKLAEAEQQAAGRAGELAGLDRAFLDASRERRRQRRQRAALGVVGILLAAAILTAGWLVLRVTNQQETNRLTEESARLAALGESLQFSEPDLAALLEVESNLVYQTQETVSALLGVLNGNPRLERIVRLADLYDDKVVGSHILDGPELGASQVRAVAISPDGEMLAAAVDFVVYLIDRQSGALVGGAPLALENGSSATDLAFSPDGNRLIVPDLSGAVTVWDLTTDSPAQQSFQAAPGVINGFALDPAGNKMVVIGKNGATVWPLPEDVTTSQPAELLSGKDARSVAWSPDGALVAVGDSNGTVSLVGDGRSPVVTLTGPKGIVKAVAFSPDSTLVAAAIETSNKDLGESTVLVWPIGEDQPSEHFVNDRGTVTSLAFVQDGTALATGGKDNHIDVWNLQSGLPQDQPLRGSRQSVSDMAYDAGSQTLVSGDGDGRVFLWRFDTPNRLARPLLGHTDQVYAVAFSPDDALLASGGKDGTVRLWNLASGDSQVLGTHTPLVRSVAFNPGGDLLASAGLDDIKLWQLQPEPKLLHTLTGPGAEALGDLVFSSDGQIMATSDSDTGAIYLWDMAGQPPQARQLATDFPGPLPLAFAPDGGTLYAANAIGEIHSWDTSTGEPGSLAVATGDGSPLFDLIVNPSGGNELVAASANSAVYVWNREDGAPYGIGLLAGHSLAVAGISASAASGDLASVSHDGQLILWDFGSQQPIGVFRGHDGPVNAVAFSHDGQWVATAGDDHTVLLWQATPYHWHQAACQLAARSFSDKEVERYLAYGRTPSACSDLATSATP